MTLAPLVRPDIRGVEGKPAPLLKTCVVPGCISLAQQRHHCWPKSYLRGQPYEWVEVGGKIYANSVGLCMTHHDVVSSPVGGHIGHIRWNEQHDLFEWWVSMPDEGWHNLGPLDGQGVFTPEPKQTKAQSICPSCGRAKPRTTTALPKRKAKTWAIMVPDDGEVGTDILDTYIEDLGTLMGLNGESPRLLRYHVLVPVLEWVSQQKAEFITDWEEGT